ncbi:NADH-quinone oxidoreductase subunit J [Chloroflexota bacterium]
MGIDVAFWILAVVGVVAALAVVLLRNVFRSALSLVVCFLAVAGIYITLSADFLAVIQILVYVGAVSILIILAIMLTKGFQRGSLSNKLNIPALVVAAVFLGVVIYATTSTAWPLSGEAPLAPTTQGIGLALFGEGGFILPLEIAAVLLLAAILGAIVLVREKK